MQRYSNLITQLIAQPLDGQGVYADDPSRMSNAKMIQVCSLITLLLISFAGAAQPKPEERLRVSLLTVGPGQPIFERFGHNTIVFENLQNGKTISFNYGVFNFDDPGFIGRFLEGKMMYCMQAKPLSDEVAYYRSTNRPMLLQELSLSTQEAARLYRYLWANHDRDQGRYLYNYYTSNCSTKVRDALDYAFDGELRRQLESRPTHSTYREHTRRSSQYNFFMYTGLYFGLGPSGDRPLSQWDDAFMPGRLADHIRNLKLADERNMVVSERYLTDLQMPPERPVSDWAWLYLLIGALWSGLILWAVKAGRNQLVLIVVWLWFALSATGGVFVAWIFTTNHWAGHWNQNVLLLPTTSLLMAAWWPVAMMPWNRWKWVTLGLSVVGGAVSAVGLFMPLGLSMLLLAGLVLVPRNLAARGVAALLVLTLGCTVIAISLKYIPWMPQMNREIMALAGPLNAAVVWAGWRSLNRVKEELHGSIQ